jgi:hypothetical protein
MVDVSGKHPALVKKLQSLHLQWEKRIGVLSEEELATRRKALLKSAKKRNEPHLLVN